VDTLIYNNDSRIFNYIYLQEHPGVIFAKKYTNKLLKFFKLEAYAHNKVNAIKDTFNSR